MPTTNAIRSDPGAALRVPRSIDEAMDKAWLSQALARETRGADVRSVEVAETIRTMATKIRFAIRFDGDGGRPRAYCLKAFLGTEPEVEAGGETTLKEVDFFTEVAPHTTMRVPRCVATVIDRKAPAAVLIMNDLLAEGAQFCSALEPFTPDFAAKSLEQLARLHAASPILDRTPWIGRRIDRLSVSTRFLPDEIQVLLNDPRGEGLTPETRSAKLLFAGMKSLAARNAVLAESLLHGDCHAGNIFKTPEGPGFTDWQLIQRGNWSFDVAYHIASVLPVEVAEREERALLDHYLRVLRTLVDDEDERLPGRGVAWREYRCAQVYGFFHWAVTRRVDPQITRVFIERLGAAVTRHETYSMLGLDITDF